MHVVPAALAVAQARHRSGRELLDAVLVGYEATARLFEAFRNALPGARPRHLGAVGAALVVARLDGEDPLAVASIAAGTRLLTSWLPCYEGATVRNTFIGYAARPPDAEAVARVRAAGAVIVGKTTTMDLGIGMPDTSRDGSSGFPVPRNPWDGPDGPADPVRARPVLSPPGPHSGRWAPTRAAPFASRRHTAESPASRRPSVPCRRRAACRSPTHSTGSVRSRAATATARCWPACLPAPPTSRRRRTPAWPARIGVDRLAPYSMGRADPRLDVVFDAALESLDALGARVLDVSLPFYDELVFARAVLPASRWRITCRICRSGGRTSR